MFFAAQNNTWLAAQGDVFDNFYDVRTAKSSFFAENAPFFVLNIKLEFGVFSRTHTWPSPFLKSKVFFKKLIASYLSNDEQGEVTSGKYNQRDVIRKSINTGSL